MMNPSLVRQTPGFSQMDDESNLVHELLDMAARPERFAKSELGLMLLVAATEIIKLQELGPRPTSQRVRRDDRALPGTSSPSLR
jgi:hypothetical protein